MSVDHPSTVEISPAAVDGSHGPCRTLPDDAGAPGCADTPWTTDGDTSTRTYRGHRLVVIAEIDGPYAWQTWSPTDEWAPVADGESASATFARCYAEEAAENGDGPATTARALIGDLTGAVDA